MNLKIKNNNIYAYLYIFKSLLNEKTFKKMGTNRSKHGDRQIQPWGHLYVVKNIMTDRIKKVEGYR